jgi:hypothetical protein
MALFEDLAGAELLGVNVVTWLAVGAAALFVAPLAAPILRPAKAAIKGGLYAYQSAAELSVQRHERARLRGAAGTTHDSADSRSPQGRPGSSPTRAGDC